MTKSAIRSLSAVSRLSGASGNTYTFQPKNIASNIAKAIAKSTGIAFGDGLAKNRLLKRTLCGTEATITTARQGFIMYPAVITILRSVGGLMQTTL